MFELLVVQKTPSVGTWSRALRDPMTSTNELKTPRDDDQQGGPSPLPRERPHL